MLFRTVNPLPESRTMAPLQDAERSMRRSAAAVGMNSAYAAPDFRVSIEPPKAITTRQECELIRSALARNPGSRALQQRLASTLVVTDQYDEAIELLARFCVSGADANSLTLLANALLSRETEAQTRSAGEAALQAADAATHAVSRAHALATLGKVQMRLGELNAARRTLTRALEENPHDRNAYKRLVALLLSSDEPGAVLALAKRLLNVGVTHSRLLASRTLAFAKLNDVPAAIEADGLDRFHDRTLLSPPEGWSNAHDFNRALTQELLDHPALRYDRYGTASTKTWRIDEPGTGRSPQLAALQRWIATQVEAFVSRMTGAPLPRDAHPWLRARPNKGMLHNWCVITDGPGFEEWHVHQNGWLSGVYYVAVPERIRSGQDESGCLCFGLPEQLVGEQAAAAFGRHWVRPEAGMLMLFPSHAYHRTFPHGVTDRRICLAFDIWPT